MVNIARNLCFNQLKTLGHSGCQKSPSVSDDIEEIAVHLSPQEIQVFDLVYFKGYNKRKIVEETGCEIEAVGTCLRSAILILRSALNEKKVQEKSHLILISKAATIE